MNNQKVLVVDDEVVSRTVLRKVLEKHGYICLEAVNGEEARILLETEDLALALFDIGLPDVSGLDLLKEVRSTKDALTLPVIMVTASSDTQDFISALKMGANDYITKPVNFEVALTRVSTQLKLSELSKISQAAKELQAVNSMIITFNHEINNPLAIAMGFLQQVAKTVTSEKEASAIERSRAALNRIAEIVKAVNHMAENGQALEYDTYTQNAKMIKIK